MKPSPHWNVELEVTQICVPGYRIILNYVIALMHLSHPQGLSQQGHNGSELIS